MSRELIVGVVGGGASGAMTAIALLRHPSPRARRVIVVEPAAEIGAGVAFSTTSPNHLLNVRAKAMSGRQGLPDDLVNWARSRGVEADGSEFLPRPLYRQYLQETLADAVSSAPAGSALQHRRAHVADVQPAGENRLQVTLSDGTSFEVDHLVLATGNVFRTPKWLPADKRIVVDPWRQSSIDSLRDSSSIVVAGTGLTAVDAVLSLAGGPGFAGVVHMVSTHGLLPAPHTPGEPAPRAAAVVPGSVAAGTARGLVRAMRADAARADDWRQTIDSVRPVATELWIDLPEAEQRRLMRHLVARWSVLRHRMAPQVAATLDQLQRQGKLTIGKGRVVAVAAHADPEDRLTVTLSFRGRTSTQVADALVWCAGPSADPAAHPLLAALIGAGTAAPHPLGIGLAIEPDGRVRAASGDPWPNLWTLGPLRKGADWETLAVPEIRGQAQAIAAAILDGAEPAS